MLANNLDQDGLMGLGVKKEVTLGKNAIDS